MSDQTRLAELVERCEELREQGQSVSPRVVAERAGCPELADELERRIEALDSVNRRLESTNASSVSVPTGARASRGDAPPPPPEDIATQTNYHAGQFIGKGGMGEVFVAQDAGLGREVALKLIQRPGASDAGARSRFLREAEITSRLEHPGVVPVYGMGQDREGRPCYAMRLVQGETLDKAIRGFHETDKLPSPREVGKGVGGAGAWRDPGERRLAFRQLLGRFVSVCNTIAYAHSRGIVHRDLKPMNIMLGKYGETLLLDWGLAKSVERDAAASAKNEKTLMPSSGNAGSETRTGEAMGTPGYRSPEQAAGNWDEVGPASDIYSLGATLYKLLTGCSPVEGRNPGEIIDRVRHGEVALPRQRNQAVPRALEAICLKAMASRRKDRYCTASELADDVEHWLADEPVSAWREPLATRARRWMRRRQKVVTGSAAAGVVALLSLGLGTAVLSAKNRQLFGANRDLRSANERESAARELADESFRQAQKAVKDFYIRVSEDKLLHEPGMQPLRRDLLQQALDYYKSFLDRRSTDPTIRKELASVYALVGMILMEIGPPEEALTNYERAREILEQFLNDNPSDRPSQQLLTNVYDFTGDIQKDQGQWDAALSAYSASLRIRQRFAGENPTDAESKSQLSSSYNRMALLYAKVGAIPKADEEHTRALTFREELVRDHPNDMNFRSDLASTLFNIASLRNEDEKIPLLLRAVEMDKRTVEEQPRNSFDCSNLAKSYESLGIAYRVLGKVQEAIDAFQNSLDLQEQLVKSNPAVQGFKHGLARTCDQLAFVLHQNRANPKLSEPLSRALRLTQRALELLEDVRQTDPKNIEYQDYLATVLNMLALIQRDMGQPDESLKTFQDALAINERLAGENSTSLWLHENLGITYFNLGQLHKKYDRWPEAMEAYQKALEVRERLVLAESSNDGFRDRLEAARNRICEVVCNVAREGDHARAIQEADKLAAASQLSGENLYNLACVYSIASGAVGRDKELAEILRSKLTEQCGARAVEMLQHAQSAGFFSDLANVEHMKKDADLEPVRSREDFLKLIR